MRALITGSGNMGRAIASGLEARGDQVAAMAGRETGFPDPAALGAVDVAFEFSHHSTLLEHVDLGLGAGCRAFVVGTTGWTADDDIGRAFATRLADNGARAVVAPTFSLAAVLFGAISEYAASLFGSFSDYDPYLLEQHRAAKADRPSGTALAVADRLVPHLKAKREARLATDAGAPDPEVLEIVALRAGSHPGMHTVGFDGPGESLQIKVEARDRSAYVAGALLSADFLTHQPDRTGITAFTDLVRERTA
ncbi:MAG: dihydrodipicolinate reductase C-terminal domain-containing protein [Candidatus Limnocylindrales bacterium]